MKNELKPCPLCGLNVATVTTCANLEECENFETCEDSGFHIVVCDVNKGGCGTSSGYRKTYDAAVKAWNRRATDKPLDIKGQLRLVRDKCPDVWQGVYIQEECPKRYGLDGIDKCGNPPKCKECWDKALEGDE